ncbi:MAG: regulatory protein GemA [Geminicoccaceae bacterium]
MDRRAQLALVHMGRKQLGLDEDTYRQLLERVAGRRSAGELKPSQLRSVIGEMRRLGFKDRPVRKLKEPQHRKIAALWAELRRAGVLREKTDRALDAFVKRQTGVERLEWLDATQSNRVIEALKSWGKRIDEAQVPG